MSDDEADPELLELLRQHLGLGQKQQDGSISRDTGVLKDARYVYDNAIDVSIDMLSTKGAAASLYRKMQQRGFSTESWSEHPLHPRKDEGFSEVDTVNFIFTMDLLNFSFWSALSEDERFQVEYRGKCWTGYNSLVACLRRALDENIPITSPRFWRSQQCSDQTLHHVFQSATAEHIPLLTERMAILRDVAQILHEEFSEEDDISTSSEQEFLTQDQAPEKVEVDEAYSQAPARTTSLDQHDSKANDDGQPSVTTHEDQNNNNALSGNFSNLAPTVPVDNEQHQSVRTTGEIRPDVVNAQHTVSADEQPAAVTASSIGPVSSIGEIEGHISDEAGGMQHGPIQPRGHGQEVPDHTVMRLIESAEKSAGRLVNILIKYFPSFRDEFHFENRRVRFLKRAQIFVADLWAAFNGDGPGTFDDIDELTMFADYRVPQMLHSLGILTYSPPLENHIRLLRGIESGHEWEIQLRGCSIWAVELLRREMVQSHPEAAVNAVLIDFFLYDLAKEKETSAFAFALPPHRTRSIWY